MGTVARTPEIFVEPLIISDNDSQTPPRYFDNPETLYATAVDYDLLCTFADIISINSNAAFNNPGGFLTNVAAALAAHPDVIINYVGSVYGVNGSSITCALSATEQGRQSALFDIARIEAMETIIGTGKVQMVVMDTPFPRLVEWGNSPTGCTYTPADSATAIVSYVQTMHAWRSSVRVCHHEDMRDRWMGVTGYSTLALADQIPDLDVLLSAINTGLAAINEVMDGFHHDSLNEYALGIVPGNPGGVDWFGRLDAVHAYVNTLSNYDHYSFMINSYFGGNPNTDAQHVSTPASSIEHHIRAVQMLDDFREWMASNPGNAGIPSAIMLYVTYYYYPRILPGTVNGDQMVNTVNLPQSSLDTARRILQRYMR